MPSLNAIFAPVAASIAVGRIPGAVLAVLAPDGTRQTMVGGMAALVPDRVKMTADTWFDLASLTKVVFTTTAILKLVEAGRIGLDDPLRQGPKTIASYWLSR